MRRAAWGWGLLAMVAAIGTVAGILSTRLPLTFFAAALGAFALWRLDRAPRTKRQPAERVAAPAVVEEPPPVERVAPSLAPDVVLASLRDAAERIAPVVAVHLWLVDEPTGTLRQIAASGLLAPAGQPTLLNSDDVLAQAVASGRAEIGALVRMRSTGEATTVWRYALPLDAAEAHGVAGIDFSSDEQPDLSAMPGAMAPLRASLSGALGLHVSKIELELAHHLVEATRELSRILDPREVLVAALHRAMALSNAETGSVMLVDETTGKLVIEVAEGLPAEIVHSTALAEGEGIAGWVLASRQPMLIEDLPARTPAARRHGIRSAASVPLADDDGILGVLNVGSRTFPARFTDTHLSSLEVLARQAATALRNARAMAESRSLYFDTLKALAVALETKDPYSRGGTDRVLEVAEDLGRAFGLPSEELHALRVAALLHDMGMAAAGDGVLRSDRPLSTVERALLKMHPQIAAEILAEVPALKQVVPIVYHHHEWYDGEGYLDGLGGEGIPLGARILAVADAYVAMTSDRPYRAAFSDREALHELTEKAGTQFDPSVVDALRDVLGGGSNRVPGPNSGRA